MATVRDTLLIVDDQESNRVILRTIFQEDYNILEAENRERALMLLQQYWGQIAAVLLDLVMPNKNGYEVMREMKRADVLSQVPVIVILSEGSVENETRSFDLGASDIITKPFEPYVVKHRVNNIVELYRHKLHLEELVEAQSMNLRESSSVLVDALSSVIEYRNMESGQHVRRIRLFTKILLENVAQSYLEYDLDEEKIRAITDASSMHDIGKIAIPDSILNKPGRLTAEEFEVIKTHTTEGCGILSGLERMRDKDYLRYAYNICRYHHERWDGNGYPDGLRGSSIPICAQVVAIADCYDALTTDRAYKKAIAQDDAFTMILNGECGAFSPRLLECFKNVRVAFAELSREYADGQPVTAADFVPGPQPLASTRNTLEDGQLKFFALLRYTGATVMEVNLKIGTYHVLYQADDNLSALRSGSRFEESIRTFVRGAVHPDDQAMVLELLGSYAEAFFREGRLKQSRTYRILDKATGQYIRYQATLLRIDLDAPNQRKVLILWQKAGEQRQFDACAQQSFGQNAIYNRLLEGCHKCANDRWYTFQYVNPGFLNLTGYTEQELADRFQNRYIELIYEPDREAVAEEIRAQTNQGDAFSLEYRVVAKDGRLIWILSRCLLATEADGKEYFYSILVDITRSKQDQEALRLSLERHQVILDQTNEIIFEWDIATDTLSLTSNWVRKFGYAPITEHVSERLPTVSHIHPDDTASILGLIHAVAAGVPYKEAEFRLAEASGRYRWCRIRATTQFDDNHKPFKAVGIISDIDADKRTTQKLIDQAERDSLTKLYNKEAGRRRIEWCLDHSASSELGAMFILDIDNFKVINDQYGHMFGDAVLTEIAAGISRQFRDADIVSRIGGDEFLIFMPSLHDMQVAEDRASSILAMIPELMREHLQDTPLSCSIGIAFFPADGRDYQTLFQHSDHALYHAKAAGKQRYCRYDSSVTAWSAGKTLENLATRTQIDSEALADKQLPGVVAWAFHRLYEASDFDAAIYSILETLGRTFNVSRVYIFENTADDAHCNNTYEWCNEGVTPEKDTLQNFQYVEYAQDYRSNFVDGLFYCTNIKKLPAHLRAYLEPQGVLALLQCAILEDRRFKGFIGFDDRTVHRLWTQEQIDTLALISRLLSVFLLKRRMQERLEAITPVQ